MQIFLDFLDFPHYARLNNNFAKSRTMQIRTKQICTKQGPTVLPFHYFLAKSFWHSIKKCFEGFLMLTYEL